ncbi:type II CRISPR RNA-guided endonuclease Cas9 [Salinarimonas chemoclinalis]|uniref:type II CRISPR RNA-guided endonuclease Cas9 n=1 Tax=Salinarimonas chemoclinalis TaxID=3241599 RepID=UPI003555C957
MDLGTTSIGFALIADGPSPSVEAMGVRIFPEARDPDGTPLNQSRRLARAMRRRLRRRRERKRALGTLLASIGLLPAWGSPERAAVMARDPYELRLRALTEPLAPYEVGRALYHLAQRRHFSGRDGTADEARSAAPPADEIAAASAREETLARIAASGSTLGALLARTPPSERRRGVHATRAVVADELGRLLDAQAPHHAGLRDPATRAAIEETILAQKPVFWRTSTLGRCPLVPDAPLCARGAWLSQQRRMLEKLANLEIVGGNARPLDGDERAAVRAALARAPSLSWPKVRAALKPLYAARGEKGGERSLRFNLEIGGEKALLGNRLEADLVRILGEDFANRHDADRLRAELPERLRAADTRTIGTQRIVVLPERVRRANRARLADALAVDFRLSQDEARALADLVLPAGWEPFSTAALEAMLPHLEAGVRMGALLMSPEHETWRDATFPGRDRPAEGALARLPSPRDPAEARHLAELRNPTVARTLNELRKVVNNLLAAHGKPDRIRIEVAREIGLSKRERDERADGMRRQERRRKEAVAALIANGIADPSRDDVEKWLLWQECGEQCPYTGDRIGFEALFRDGLFQVEHIVPRSRSFDDGMRNKTLCRRDVNAEKGPRTPYEAFGHDPERWEAIRHKVGGMEAAKGKPGMPRGKVKRFLAQSLPEDFAARQLNDTGWAARAALAQLERLWPDHGPSTPVRVEAVTGRVTAQLRHLWGLDAILGEDGRKTRADHRHHAIDALVVACASQAATQRLAQYWQRKEDPRAERPHLPPPWPEIRADAARAVAAIVCSHRVRKKVSGPLHEQTVLGRTQEPAQTRGGATYRSYVTRKRIEDLTPARLADIRDPAVQEAVRAHVEARGGVPRKAVPPYPRLGEDGPEIRRVRVLVERQEALMAAVATGVAEKGLNHHVAVFRHADGRVVFDVVSLFDAAGRLARREPVVRRVRADGAAFVMSLSNGDMLLFPDGPHAGYRVVTSVWTSGVVVTLDHRDATGASVWRPTVGSLVASGVRKVSVDPIGRVRKARD